MPSELETIGSSRARLLVRIPSASATAQLQRQLALGDGKVPFEPLCPNTDRGDGRNLAATHAWYIADLGVQGLTNAELWEAAHRANQSPALAAAGPGAFAEPDLIQEWLYTNVARPSPGALAAAPGDLCTFDDQEGRFPTGPNFAWHLGDSYTQLASARATAHGANGHVRIGILDTGIDFTHNTLPEGLNRVLARNFVGDQPATDVQDPYARGLFKNPGHGTGTLGLLAGKRHTTANGGGFDDLLGGAPDAEIVPIRIATSVILFRTSTFAQGLDYLIAPNGDPMLRADVVSMSMGGLASSAWADVVNRAYEAGITIVTAAGNNYPGTPSMIVFPALFRRVIAACGVMANGRPYTRQYVPHLAMAGNTGPTAKMSTALSAYTPNAPWAEINCANLVDMNGAGTSSATPQIAAAAALFLRQNKQRLAARQPWEVVEIVRHALFGSAKAALDLSDAEAIGRGILQANKALAMPIPAEVTKTPADTADFALLRALLGLGAAPPSPMQAMLELELTQVIQRDAALANRYVDAGLGGSPLTDDDKRNLIDIVVSHSDASTPLKEMLKGVYPSRWAATTTSGPAPAWDPRVRNPAPPARRRLRAYAFDPQMSTEYATAAINITTYDVRWEAYLEPGPRGDYLDVLDIDPASGGFYQPVDLDAAHLLASDGVTPSEGNPQFHQQMVYAVSMRTIEQFEQALGRPVLWSPQMDGSDDRQYVQRLRIYPHAIRERNAYYDPARKALLFGYFAAGNSQPGLIYPGGNVFTCLSHDIVAHETTHAILDGMQRGFLIASNKDVLAFHEAFADIVALLQHFSLPGVLEHQIAKARGNIRSRTLLGDLAVQFGEATGCHGALRSAIGRKNKATGEWEALAPDVDAIDRVTEPHERGALLVAAVFDAFMTIYETRTEDLLRIASDGTGILRDGALHPDLVKRLAAEAAKIASQVLRICIRAIDYCPPVDVTFGDYLRAMITGDTDHMPEDPYRYRVAIVDAFRRRGIYPKGLRSIAADTLVWDEPEPTVLNVLRTFAIDLAPVLEDLAHIDPSKRDFRKQHFDVRRKWRGRAHKLLSTLLDHISAKQRAELATETGLTFTPGQATFEIRSLQIAMRVGPEDRIEPQIIVAVVQRLRLPMPGGVETSYMFQGGCSLILNPRTGMTQYVVRKNVNSPTRQAEETAFRAASSTSLLGTYFGHLAGTDNSRALALLHASQLGA